MSRTESKVITESSYRKYRIKQDEDIQKAFVAQASLIENGNTQLHIDLTAAFDNKVQDLKDEVSQVKDKMGEIEARLNHIEGRSFNRSRKIPSHTIAVIGVYRDPIGFRLPTYFPSTVKEFWKLQTLAYRRKLLYLLEFYEIQNFQHWAQTHRDLNSNYAINIDDPSSNDSDSEDDASQGNLSLEQAIDKFPEVALDELASCLGLPFGEIHSFFQRAIEHRQRQRPPAIKRHSTVPTNEVVKRPKHLESQLPLDELIAVSASNSPSEPSTRISWDVSARHRAETEMLAKMRSAPGLSKESSTDIISSQETRDLGHSTKPSSNQG